MIGIVNHFGSMTSGHYTAYVKKDDWNLYDDKRVKRSIPNGDNAYLLFYQKVKEGKWYTIHYGICYCMFYQIFLLFWEIFYFK